MGVIWTPQQRTKQPQGDVGLANTALTQGIVFIEYGHGRDRKTGGLPTAGTATQGAGLGGLGLRFNGSSDYQRYVNPTGFTTPLSFFSVFVANDTTNNALVGLAKSTEDVNGMVVLRIEAGNVGIFTYESTSGFKEGRTTTTVTTGRLLTAGGSVSAAGAKTAYLSGLPGTTTTNVTSLASSDRLTLGRVDRVSPVNYFNGIIFLTAAWNRVLSPAEFAELNRNPWQLFAPERKLLIFDLGGGGSTVTGVGSSGGVGAASGVGASTSAQVGSGAGVGSASGVGASTANSVGSSSGTGAADGVGSSTGGSDGVGSASGTGTATGVGASTAASLGSSDGVGAGSGVGASTAASVGSASGTGEALGVGANGSVVSTGVGSASGTGTATGISPTVSRGGGKTTGSNLSRKQKKKLKAVESQEWLKAEETARQLLSDRFTKQTPQEKAQALETYIESLQPVIEALKALTSQIEEVAEVVEDAPVIELTPHQEVIQRFDRLEKKVKSVEELIIILMADL